MCGVSKNLNAQTGFTKIAVSFTVLHVHTGIHPTGSESASSAALHGLSALVHCPAGKTPKAVLAEYFPLAQALCNKVGL